MGPRSHHGTMPLICRSALRFVNLRAPIRDCTPGVPRGRRCGRTVSRHVRSRASGWRRRHSGEAPTPEPPRSTSRGRSTAAGRCSSLASRGAFPRGPPGIVGARLPCLSVPRLKVGASRRAVGVQIAMVLRLRWGMAEVGPRSHGAQACARPKIQRIVSRRRSSLRCLKSPHRPQTTKGRMRSG
jgi:hypothetical protein